MNFQTTMRLLCCGLVWLAVQTPASAEDFAEAIHAYLEHCVHAEIPTGCTVVGIVDEHGSSFGTQKTTLQDRFICIGMRTLDVRRWISDVLQRLRTKPLAELGQIQTLRD